ncbi:dihydrofolate reductase family protein [Acaryochloris sp. IP29b_bin.148]|uniref:dihydrofolate reductase family protein n=1 Tax=Acaryochloris sp. IP29b_bin.148 TaxID=2969218 RepID=UPI002638F04F|nr:dihydrofolate reductase family protein [Acaryochloris sp. IP29b_bin.148]
MSTKVSVFIATSLDGFIARKDGDIDWLNDANATVPEGEDCGYQSFIASVDVLIMGRKTYEQVLSFGPWPYGQIRVIVMSRSPIQFPVELPACVTHSAEMPRMLYDRLVNEGVQHLYIDGGVTIQRFFAAGLIDELTITVIPILLGEGTPLFGPLERDISLTLIRSRSYDFGFIQLQYAVT